MAPASHVTLETVSCPSFNALIKNTLWQILKAPPAKPQVYIYRYYNIDPKEGL